MTANRPKAIVRVNSRMEVIGINTQFNMGKRYLTVNDVRYSLVEAGGVWDKRGILATRSDRLTHSKVLPIETEQGTRLARQYLQKRIAHRMKDCIASSDIKKLVAIAKIIGYEIEEDDIKILDILGVDTK